MLKIVSHDPLSLDRLRRESPAAASVRDIAGYLHIQAERFQARQALPAAIPSRSCAGLRRSLNTIFVAFPHRRCRDASDRPAAGLTYRRGDLSPG
jgi:hypothetical protein